MSQNLINRWSLGRVIRQNSLDNISSIVRNLHVVREIVVVHPDSLVSGLHIVSLEWRLADDERVNDDSEGPNIDLVRVTLLAFEDLRSNVVWSTTDGSFALSVELEFSGETEITNLHLHLVVQEQVTQLKISVDDSMRVQVFDGIANLNHITLHLQLMQPLSPSEEFIKRSTTAHLKDNVHIFSIFEEVLEADDVVVVERPVDFDFRHQLLLGSRFGQRGLGDDFGRRHSLVLEVRELEAPGETSLAEELALEVPLDADLSVVLDHLLLDDGLSVLRALLGVA